MAFSASYPSPAALAKYSFGSRTSLVSTKKSFDLSLFTALTWFTVAALSSLIAWISICVCYVRFHRSLEVQGISRDDLDLKSWFQPYMAWTCIFMFSVILFFNGFEAFIHDFSVSGFFASYVTLPVVVLSFFGFRFYSWRVGRPVGFTDLKSVNLSNGPVQALRGTKYDLGS